ncbi:PIN domain-containing protein [Cyathus striatus]|nr:PIN domain-containing protein [Cyathus striatus]
MEHSQIREPYSSHASSLDNSHLHTTLLRIDKLANEDVEMKAPISEFHACVVIDTNILLHHLDVLKQFVEDIERRSFPLSIIIPGVVIYELDRQKNRNGLAWYARRASSWLLEKVKEKRSVRGQANEETCKLSGNWKTIDVNDGTPAERRNDGLILDCCMYFARRWATWLCCNDKNLCIEAERDSRRWSSRDIVRRIWGEAAQTAGVDISGFAGYSASYQYVDEENKKEDEDVMMVGAKPSHALDLLHLEVIGHFTRLLMELVIRVGGDEVAQRRGALSRHAPGWQQKAGLHEWDAQDYVEYLGSKKRVQTGSPDVGLFLSRPYSRRGARRGQDWSRRDWEVGLRHVGEIGRAWDEGSIEESLAVLEPHWSRIFALKMRPTGL